MTVKISTVPRRQFLDANGNPYSGAKLFHYAAGTTTKQTTYTSSTGATANTNPIILDSSGRTPYGVWFTSGLGYKEVFAPSTDSDPPTSPIYTEDNLFGLNDTAAVSEQQWISVAIVPTYISTTSFTVPGDQVTELSVGRRLKLITSAGTVYGRIATSAFVTVTTVTLVMDAGQVLDAGLSSFSWSILTGTNHAIPKLTNTYLTDLGIAGLTANNTLTGTLGVTGAVTLSSTLGVSGVTTIPDGTAAAPSLKFTAGGTQLGLYANSNNNYIVAVNAGLKVAEIGSYVDSGQHGNLVLHGNSATNYGGVLTYRTSRGTNAAPTIVVNGDDLGVIEFAGYDGASYQYTGLITCTVDGTPGAGDMPTSLNFHTTLNGTVTRALGMKLDNAGNLKFNSGYGSTATAYGCRAWVNFNGTGAIAIRGSGNVSSITDNGVGDYSINFTTAMVDANYSISGMPRRATSGNVTISYSNATAPTAGACRIFTTEAGTVTLQDGDICSFQVFR